MSLYPEFRGSSAQALSAGTSTVFTGTNATARILVMIFSVKGTSTTNVTTATANGQIWTKLLRVSDEVNRGVEIWAGVNFLDPLPTNTNNQFTCTWSASQVRIWRSINYDFGTEQKVAPTLISNSIAFGTSTTADPGDLAVPVTVPGEVVLTGAIYGATNVPTVSSFTPAQYSAFQQAGTTEAYALNVATRPAQVAAAHKRVLTIPSVPWAAFAATFMPATVPGSFTPNMYKGRRTAQLDLGATV